MKHFDTFPELLRGALIIPIPKPGKDNFIPLNFRPIALTSCICKTVERMVNGCLVWYLEKNGLLAKQQCVYRSCNDPKAKMLEKSRMVTRKRVIDLREET